MGEHAPGSVLVLTVEDDVADTIRPRLEAHGADLDRVFFLPALTDLRHDFRQLELALERAPDCRLIIVDPVNAYVGAADSHFHTIVRKVLSPLAKLAAEKRIAILAVTHLRKNDGAAIYRATGSMGFVAAARSVWTICRDKIDPSRQLLLPVKNNVGPLGDGLAYTIEAHEHFDAPVIRWQSHAVSTPVAEALTPSPKTRAPEAAERLAASNWLQIALAGGTRSAGDVIQEGEERGFHVRTLRRGFHDLGGQTQYRGILEGWWWSLPDAPPQDPGKELDADDIGQRDPEKPVPLKETCPLPRNTSARASAEVRFSRASSSSQPTERQSIRPGPNAPASKTGHPLLDRILQRLAETPPENVDPPDRKDTAPPGAGQNSSGDTISTSNLENAKANADVEHQ